MASRLLPAIPSQIPPPLPQLLKRRNQLIIILFLQIPDVPHAEDGILHAATVGADPHAVFVLDLQEDFVSALCGGMQRGNGIAQRLADNLEGQVVLDNLVAEVLGEAGTK